MLNGTKTEKINVAFLFQHSNDWFGGINYFKNLFCALSMCDNPRIQPFIFSQRSSCAKCLYPYSNIIDKNTFGYYLIKFFSLIFGKKVFKSDYFCKKKSIHITSHGKSVTFLPHISWIPDFQHLHLHQMFSNEEIARRNSDFNDLINKSNLVILSSNSALSDFKKFAPDFIHKARVLHFVVYISPDIYTKCDNLKQTICKKYSLPDKYFYVPNQFWKHKNHRMLFEAVRILKNQGVEINVVCSGFEYDYRNPDYVSDLKKYIYDNKLCDNIKMLGLVDNITLYFLMRNCVSIINPSLFEGWSTTVEEAKSLGKNLILSSIDVHYEQSPPEAIYFNPYNSNELAEILRKNWQNMSGGPDFELEKIAKAKMRSAMNKFAHEYTDIVLNCLSGN